MGQGVSDGKAPERTGRPVVTGRRSVDDAVSWIDGNLSPLGPETVPLAEARGRVLAEDVSARVDLPPFDRAAVDGIAVRAEETAGAGAYNPLSFRLVSGDGAVPTDGAVRVSAGDRLPAGLDAVVQFDFAEPRGGACDIIDPVAPGNGVEPAASSFTRGAVLAAAGRRLMAHDLGLLAAGGLAQVPVVRRPSVDVIVVEPPVLRSGAIHEANGALLGALIERDGEILCDSRRVLREGGALTAALAAASGDVVLMAGATGPGPDDAAAAALAEAGTLVVHGVALSPGETAGFGRLGQGVPVFLLPGAPAACLAAYEILAGRALRRLGGRDPALPYRSRSMAMARKLVSSIGRMEIAPVRLRPDGLVEPAGSFANSGLAAAAGADGFVVIPEGSEGVAQGAQVTVYLYDDDDNAGRRNR